LELDRRFCIKNANKLDLLDKNSNWIHGHYEAMKNQKATIAYITKLIYPVKKRPPSIYFGKKF
jgi:hypothetical protein